ncbi:MAG: hypothetical protein HN742_20350 [Lentisphaerae bacterium]|jgi:dienelactone hydrolase|nr:hypothetical protein [Lentisphaerota bacterium]MBT7055061.1 hypothetical protein [Lentisphaerota bacterium]MBT7844243.1 hypothetical protein [Lentisphaerota bacterium]
MALREFRFICACLCVASFGFANDWTTIEGRVARVRHGKAANFYTVVAADGTEYTANSAHSHVGKNEETFKAALASQALLHIEFLSHQKHPDSIWAIRKIEPVPSHTPKERPKTMQNLPPAIDGATWDLSTWRAWPFDYEEIGAHTAPIAFEKVGDWTSIGDSWVAKNGGNTEAIRVRNVKADFEDLTVTDFYITVGGNENGPNRVFCATAVPIGVQERVPVLFVFHGGGGHASGALALAIARKNPGFAAVAVDYNGQFRPSKSPVTQWVTVTKELKERKHNLVPNKLNFPMYHFAQASRRVLDWVDVQPWADRQKYGAVGISYGGWVSFFIAGQDERIKTVYTGVSAAGTEGMRGRACQAHDWRPTEQVSIWMANADPAVYAKQTQAKVYLNLSTVDRFFWLDGAARQRDTFPRKAQWLLKPNSDHGNGGTELPDPIGLWHRAAMLGDTAFPSFRKLECTDTMAVATIDSEKPLQAVYLAWSPGNAVSVARYYLWIRAQEKGGRWSARIPDTLRSLRGTYYFTAIDEDGRAVSSDLMKNRGDGIRDALVWQDGCLWDVASGAAAWRSDLAGDRAAIRDARNGRVTFTPTRPDKRVAVLTNSFVVAETARMKHRGIRVELGGNGFSFKTNVVLSRDYQSLDMQKFAAEITVSEDVTTFEIPWDTFTTFERGTTENNNLPANGLVLITPAMPEGGLTVGRVAWLEHE